MKRSQPKQVREATRELSALEAGVSSQRTFDQHERASLARRAHALMRHEGVAANPDLRERVSSLHHRAIQQAYPLGFRESYDVLRAGDPGGFAMAIRFLEDDPWFIRSGYVEENLLRFIARVEPAARDVQRLDRACCVRWIHLAAGSFVTIARSPVAWQ